MRKNIATHSELAQLSLKTVRLIYTVHALDRCKQKNIPTHQTLDSPPGSIVEIELTNGRIDKVVSRVSHSPTHDLVLVLVPITKTVYRVITVWFNNKDDNHSTLNLERISA